MSGPICGEVGGVFFDLDGTLLYNVPAIEDTNKALVKKYTGRTLSTHEWKSMNAVCSDRAGFESWGIKEPFEKVDADYKRLSEEAYRMFPPVLFTGAEETLYTLLKSGKKLGMVSSSPTAERDAKKYGIRGYFSVVCEDCSDKTSKLRELQAEYGFGPGEMAFVDDLPRGVRAAKDAGREKHIVSIGKLGGFALDRDLIGAVPDYTIRELPELLALLL